MPTVLVRSRKWEARFLDCEAVAFSVYLHLPFPLFPSAPTAPRICHTTYLVCSRNFTSFLSIIPFSLRARSLMLARYCPECVRSK